VLGGWGRHLGRRVSEMQRSRTNRCSRAWKLTLRFSFQARLSASVRPFTKPHNGFAA
jgi:hypothetical protein